MRTEVSRLADPAQAVDARSQLTALLQELEDGVSRAPTPETAPVFVYALVSLEAADPLGDAGRRPWLERALELGATLEFPSRDALVLTAATQLSEFLRRDGDLESVCTLLEDAVARHASASPERVAALTLLGDTRRQLGAWPSAAEHLLEAERVMDALPTADPRGPWIRFNLASASFQLRLDWGHLDEAGVWLERQEAAAGAIPRTDEGELALLLAHVNFELATVQHTAAVERMEAALADEQRFAGHPAYRARLAVRLGMALEELARSDPGRTSRAREVLESALRVSGLDAGDRQLAESALIEACFRASDLAAVDELLARTERHLDEKRAGERDELVCLITAWRARLDLARDASDDALAARLAGLERAYETVLAA